MQVNNENYYNSEVNKEYMSVSQYKMFAGTKGQRGCEAHAMAVLNGEWQDETTKAMLIGAYVDSYFEGTLDIFKQENEQIFTQKGDLKADFKKAEEVIKRIEKDDLFMYMLSGEKQKIFTFELFGIKWKTKLDSYIKNRFITDLKIVQDISASFWVKDYGYMNFIEYWGYDLQMAIYQKGVEIVTGEKLPCFIAVADKGKSPNIDILAFDKNGNDLKTALNEIEDNIYRINNVKNGLATPDRCEQCDYCKATKKLKEATYHRLIIYQ